MKLNLKSCVLVFGFYFLIFTFLCGCQSLQKKFIRKSKDEPKKDEPILAPEVYNPVDNKEALYKNYLVYWRSWQDELIAALEAGLSHKKQLDCAEQAVMNLDKLREFLIEEKQQVLDKYLIELRGIRDEIKQANLTGAKLGIMKNKLAANRRNILHNFMYSKIKSDLR